MKKVALLGIILLNVHFLSAQEYHIQKEKKQLFLLHTVKAKESLFSLARLYNLSHKDIAAANKLDANAGLKTGEQVKVPLNKNNFVQAGQKKPGYAPVYHTVAKGENLYKLSKNYNNVKEDQLKRWNKLSKNVVKQGQELVVGFVKVSHFKQEIKEEAVAVVPKQKMEISKPKPMETKTESNTTGIVKTVESKTTNNDPVITTAEEKKAEWQAKDEPVVFAMGNANTEGFFASQFAVNNAAATPRIVTGMAATFKSTSGWEDKKYYILINEIPVGTIVKVNANNRTIYAKVLESLPGLKDNKDLVCRLSNAAASALGITGPKFTVELYYSE